MDIFDSHTELSFIFEFSFALRSLSNSIIRRCITTKYQNFFSDWLDCWTAYLGVLCPGVSLGTVCPICWQDQIFRSYFSPINLDYPISFISQFTYNTQSKTSLSSPILANMKTRTSCLGHYTISGDHTF